MRDLLTTARDTAARISTARTLRRRWTDARTARDVATLTGQWLTGDLPYNPAYGGLGYPDSETSGPLAEACGHLCRAGVITLASQPGGEGTDHDGSRWTSAAYLYALADQTAVRILRKALTAVPGVHLHAVPLRRRGDAWDGAPRTVATLTSRGTMSHCGGWHPTLRDLSHYYGGALSREALADIARHCAHLVTIWAADRGTGGEGMWEPITRAAQIYAGTR